jgi:uncharacterized membrane protein
MTGKTLGESVNAVERLLGLFKFERCCYLIITIISFLVLLFIAILLLIKDFKNNYYIVIGLFVPSGAIVYTCGRILKMWNDALQFISDNK